MRSLPPLSLVLLPLAVSAAFACGGGTTGGQGDGGPLPDAGGALDGNGGNDSAADAPLVDASGQTCEELRASIDALRPKASECCPLCRSLQCTQTVEDLCCPFSATTVDPSFVTLVAEHKKRCGPARCPDIPCNSTPSNQCDPATGGPNTGGTCR